MVATPSDSWSAADELEKRNTELKQQLVQLQGGADPSKVGLESPATPATPSKAEGEGASIEELTTQLKRYKENGMKAVKKIKEMNAKKTESDKHVQVCLNCTHLL